MVFTSDVVSILPEWKYETELESEKKLSKLKNMERQT